MRRPHRFLARRANAALLLLTILLLLFGLSLVDGWRHSRSPIQSADTVLVRELGLTDLSLFTEARYTRHPSQADRFSAFQDHPAALDHFPSGALLPPPPALSAPSP
ncbi:MAG TPA: hypothetical protein PKI41_04135 [Candidatus Competibacteraceae bacterium]|nr:hypothetical protein [Candidatus Competibacteraceae bacterium]HQD55608.1 hypothetical protein [Candidatus Competibacteraceae bacterium]